MPENRGKQFEDIFRKCAEEVKGIAVVRLHDQTTGYIGSKNPCDFFLYKYPYLYAIECKSVHGNRLPFKNITEYQWEQLTVFSRIDGVVSGVVCWYIDRDVTVFIPMQVLNVLKDNGAKSVSYEIVADKKFYTVELKGRKKRVFFEYDLNYFFNKIEEDIHNPVVSE